MLMRVFWQVYLGGLVALGLGLWHWREGTAQVVGLCIAFVAGVLLLIAALALYADKVLDALIGDRAVEEMFDREPRQ